LLYLLYLLYKWLKKKLKRKPRIKSKTVQKNPGSRKRTTIGVGEEVDLTYTGGLTTWATTRGQLSVAPGVPAAKVRFDAPDTAGPVVITAGTASITFNVLAPSGVSMKQLGGLKHFKNTPTSGLRLRPHLLPDTVNFYKVTFHEMDLAFGTATGHYSCNPFSTGHCGKGGGNAPCNDIDASNKVVRGRGTEVLGNDCAYSGFCPGNPLTPGQVSENIPHEYKVRGPTGGAFHAFPAVFQQHTLEPDGVTCFTRKGGAADSIKVTANNSSNGC
jgi:hypothetical protein